METAQKKVSEGRMEKRKLALASIVSHLNSIVLKEELIQTCDHSYSYEK